MIPSKTLKITRLNPSNEMKSEPFITLNGQPYEIPVEGSLTLLALGYKGIMVWRQKRLEANLKKNINK